MSDLVDYGCASVPAVDGAGSVPAGLNIVEAKNHRGYSDISTVYAYYTAGEKARHGKHCEWWTNFGHRPENAPYRTHEERDFIAKLDADRPGIFASYLISWSGSD